MGKDFFIKLLIANFMLLIFIGALLIYIYNLNKDLERSRYFGGVQGKMLDIQTQVLDDCLVYVRTKKEVK